MQYQEIEIKLYVKNIQDIADLLRSKKAQLIQPRTHELNLRFDTVNGELTKNGRLLRLRKDRTALLTYKGQGQIHQGARIRTEIQTIVADFEATKAILEQLGYQVNLIYEKYRAEYEWQGTHISLDEMPYGNFVEIEGLNPEHIHLVCGDLGLNWEQRIPWSYAELFYKICEKEQIPPNALTFDAFKDRKIILEDYGIFPATE